MILQLLFSMTPASPSPRNEFVDYAKGVLIFLVTLGHVIQFVICRSVGFYQNPLFKAIYLFHMPLFMALAGYVAFGSLNRTPPGKFVFRRVINLVLPVFSWSVLAYAALFVIHPVKNIPGATPGVSGSVFWQPLVFVGFV